MLGQDGRTRCAATEGGLAEDRIGIAGGGADGFTLGRPSVVDGRLLIAARSAMSPGAVVASFDPDTLPAAGGKLHYWLLAGDPTVVLADVGAAFPGREALLALLAMPSGHLEAATRTGQAAAYAIREVSPGLHLMAGLLVGDSSAEMARPAIPLLTISLLMAAAIVLMTLGVERIVVLPMRRLDGAVRRWRGGAPADAGELTEMPRELRELTLSFADAIAALAQRENELRSALAQQDLLMQEIHHRVKNNLQIVASLLNLQASRIRQPDARAEFQSARDRVRALATLHRHLYGHGELHTINMRAFLNELCAQLFQSFHEEVGARINLVIDASELQMSSDQAVPVALLVTETVSNALKFAFPAGRAGEIKVSLAAAGDLARLVIEDDGIGLPPKDKAGGREGIGLDLIRGFARQLGATLTPSHEGGTRYEIDIKIVQRRPAETAAAPERLEAHQ